MVKKSTGFISCPLPMVGAGDVSFRVTAESVSIWGSQASGEQPPLGLSMGWEI